jgi:phospholipid/cholesterol/gamma-HCH transport system permease protein
MTSAENILADLDLGTAPNRIVFDFSGVGRWDSALVSLMVQLRRICEGRNIEVKPRDMPEGLRRLVDLALAVPEQAGAKRTEKPPAFLESTGQQFLDAVRSSGEMLQFLGEAIIALGNAARGRARFRSSDVLLVLQECGPQALPIVTLISFLVGMILAFVGLVQLEQFGADIFVANLVAVAMVREMGGMMTAIIMAGRTGAAFAAQLGTMNVNDEIAAFRTIGIPPNEFLVLPRMLALIFAVPLRSGYAWRIRRHRVAVGCLAPPILCPDHLFGDTGRLGRRSLQGRRLRHHHCNCRVSSGNAKQEERSGGGRCRHLGCRHGYRLHHSCRSGAHGGLHNSGRIGFNCYGNS